MVGNRIRYLREEKEISQKKLAEYIKVSPSTIGMYEQERRVPSAEILNIIAEFFNVSVDYLMGRTDTRNDENKYDINKKSQEILEVIKRAGVNLEKIDYDKLEQLLKLSNVEKQK